MRSSEVRSHASEMKSFQDNHRLILGEIDRALSSVDPGQVEALVNAVTESEKVFFVGVGRVMLSLQAMAKRFCHLGVDAHCVGDIGEPAIAERDLLIVGSGSGESVVPVAVARVARKHGAKIAHIGSNPESSLCPLTDIFVRIPVKTKLSQAGEIPSSQIMTSLFEQSLYDFGDAVAMMLAERMGIVDTQSLWRRHANLE